MSEAEPEALTQQLRRLAEGDSAGGQELMAQVLDELRKIARNYMRKESAGHTLQPTALVNEVYLRIFSGKPVEWVDRVHFFALAARQMRQVLTDHSRMKNAEKRGAGAVKVELFDHYAATQQDASIELLNSALDELEKMDSRAARIVELKFFGGLEDKDVAEVLGISFARVRRDWTFAKAFLHKQLSV